MDNKELKWKQQYKQLINFQFGNMKTNNMNKYTLILKDGRNILISDNISSYDEYCWKNLK